MFALKRLPQRNILVKNVPTPPKPVPKVQPKVQKVQKVLRSNPIMDRLSMKGFLQSQNKSCASCGRK